MITRMKTRCFFAALAMVAMTLQAASGATLLSFGATDDLPNGVLGLSSLTVNGAEVRFTNPGSKGFDVGFTLTSPNLALPNPASYFGTSDEPTLPNPPAPAGGYFIYIAGATGAPNTIYLETRFYATGTNTPVDVTGLKLQLEDVERGDTTREWVVGPKIVTGGVTQSLSFSDTSIFTVPDGPNLSKIIESTVIDGEPLERAVPGWEVESGGQPGKTVGIDLADTPLSYFRVGMSKTGNGGAWMIGTLGEIEIAVVPEPASLGLAGFAAIGLTAVRRRRRD